MYDISDNRLLDSDILKKSKISFNKPLNKHVKKKESIHTDIVKKSNISLHTNVAKKDMVDPQYQGDMSKYQENINNMLKHAKIKQRGSIDNAPLDSLSLNVGKPYGDPDTYQSIGDGVYLMNNPIESESSNKNKIKPYKGLPDTAKTLNVIIGNLDSEDKKLLSVTKGNPATQTVLPTAMDNDFSSTSDAGVAHSLQTNALAVSSNENLEGIAPNELSMISDIQKDLKASDQEDEYYRRNNSIKEEKTRNTNDKTGIEDIASAVENYDKNYLKNNPFAMDVENADMVKKDLTVDMEKEAKYALRRNPEAVHLVDRVNKQDDQIRSFAGRTGEKYFLGPTNYDDADRARNIVNFAAQEDAEILVGGSRSHKAKKQKKHRKKLKKRKKSSALNSLQVAEDIEMQIDGRRTVPNVLEEKHTRENGSGFDTGFFMADEGDIADLNKKTADYVSNTVNASLIKVIRPNTEDVSLTNKSVKDILEELKSPEPVNTKDQKAFGNSHEHKLSTENASFPKQEHIVLTKQDAQDISLYKTLNKTGNTQKLQQRSKQKYGSVLNTLNGMKPTKVIKVAGKPGVQIDLYITNNKVNKSRKKNNNVRKASTPEAEVNNQSSGNKRFISDAETDLDDGSYSAGSNGNVEDVSINEAVTNQEKQMFGDTNVANGNEYGSDKATVDEIQTNHVEGMMHDYS